jgi:UDP-glucose 4-epimerase
MKIFLTGGTGFIGSHFLKLALAEGHEVVASRRPESIPRISLLTQPEWVVAALDTMPRHVFQSCDVLVHAAAYGVSPQPCEWDQAMTANVVGPLKLVQDACAAGITRFLVVGSCVEFGAAASDQGPIPPDHRTDPIGAYAGSKAAFTNAFTAFAREKKLQSIVARVFHAYGDGQYERNFWPSLRKAALAGEDFSMTTGEQIRDFTAVSGVAEQLLLAAVRDDIPRGNPVFQNIGTGKPQSLRDFAESWWKHWGATGTLNIGAIPRRPNEVMRYVPELSSQSVCL